MASNANAAAAHFLTNLDAAAAVTSCSFEGTGDLPSAYAVTDFAAASVAMAAIEAQRLSRVVGNTDDGCVVVDRRLASLWFRQSARPIGWNLPPPWDPIAGDYRAADGWIRLHTNAAHHRRAALSVLECAEDRDAVASAVATCTTQELEEAVVAAGGCAAAMRAAAEWTVHQQGASVRTEPVLHMQVGAQGETLRGMDAQPGRPLRGVRVLDLTRVLAGPVATRFLAGLGAEVLRIDPPDWDEPGVLPEVTLGKRRGRLDLRSDEGMSALHSLLGGAHILVHGYRPDALARLGLDADQRQQLAPGLVDVSLDGYGWTGPWASRRGFDSLVQMSTGIADTGMRRAGTDRPFPLPVQALDHATGHLMAAAALRGWRERIDHGKGSIMRTSLARMAAVLESGPGGDLSVQLEPVTVADEQVDVEHTDWGPARRLRPPCMIPGVDLRWARPAGGLGTEPGPLAWSP